MLLTPRLHLNDWDIEFFIISSDKGT